MTDLVQLDKLLWLESADRSCMQCVSLVRIGRKFELVALRHLLLSGNAHS